MSQKVTFGKMRKQIFKIQTIVSTSRSFFGVKRAVAGSVSPLECFQLFMTKDILEQIVQETNRYHMQEHTKEASTVKWLNSTLEELQVLFGVILATGLIKLPEIDDYWREGALTGMRVQFMECHGFLRSFDKTISNSCYATFI